LLRLTRGCCVAIIAVTRKGASGALFSEASMKNINFINLIDPKRSTNLGIQLHRLNLKPKDIRTALLRMNRVIMTIDRLDVLIQCLPTKEEAESVNSFMETAMPEQVDRLGKVEKFFFEISQIPEVDIRLKSFHTMQLAHEKLSSIRDDSNTIRKTLQDIQQSDNLKQVLRVALAIGNALNAGSNRGDAAGFKLDTLTKLRDTKTADNSMTLLHFLALKVVELNGEVG
jgi:diaphanous 1